MPDRAGASQAARLPAEGPDGVTQTDLAAIAVSDGAQVWIYDPDENKVLTGDVSAIGSEENVANPRDLIGLVDKGIQWVQEHADAELLGDEDKVAKPLSAARDVGLGYLVLRQPAYALSGGEAQRLRIAKELCRTTTSDTLYILDEPTVGQHLEDVTRLNGVLRRLVDGDGRAGSERSGNSVFVVEHHPHLLAACDWLIELGPGGGPEGGHAIVQGTPEMVAQGGTPTASYLQEILEGGR